MANWTSNLSQWTEERWNLRKWLSPILDTEVTDYKTKMRFCWGGMTFALIVLELVTGIFLAYYYQPSVKGAFQSIAFITDQVHLGWLVRGIHHYASYLIIVTVVVHMMIVFFRGAYKPPREMTWVSGIFLLVLCFAFSFTGYLLTWDQRGYWATRIGTGMASELPIIGEYLMIFLQGGYGVKQPTIIRFFISHVIVLPLFLIGLLLAHFLMIRRQGIKKSF